jgi:hypothetical protein
LSPKYETDSLSKTKPFYDTFFITSEIVKIDNEEGTLQASTSTSKKIADVYFKLSSWNFGAMI